MGISQRGTASGSRALSQKARDQGGHRIDRWAVGARSLAWARGMTFLGRQPRGWTRPQEGEAWTGAGRFRFVSPAWLAGNRRLDGLVLDAVGRWPRACERPRLPCFGFRGILRAGMPHIPCSSPYASRSRWKNSCAAPSSHPVLALVPRTTPPDRQRLAGACGTERASLWVADKWSSRNGARAGTRERLGAFCSGCLDTSY